MIKPLPLSSAFSLTQSGFFATCSRELVFILFISVGDFTFYMSYWISMSYWINTSLPSNNDDDANGDLYIEI